MLTFPEPGEFCLGYTSVGTRGSGGGRVLANQMMNAVAVALAAGLADPKHIEELGILNEGIGADRISDAVCNVLKGRFIRYTQLVAARHGLPLDEHSVRNGQCFVAEGRWATAHVLLPTNPTNGHAVLLCPRRFLNDLPTLNADDWFDSHLNQDLRDELNVRVGQEVRKRDIVRYARRHPDRVREWAREVASDEQIRGYNFDRDPKGLAAWDAAGRGIAETYPIEDIAQVASQDDLRTLLVTMLDNFKRFVEEQGGWRLLWDADARKPKPEEAIQLLFLGMAQHYFRQHGVELDREVELGRGPVDFKLSGGAIRRLLIEVKKAENGKFWNGLEFQLPSYLQSDDTDEGWFVAVRFSSTKDALLKVATLPRRVASTAEAVGKDLRSFVIDARPKKSASNLRKGNG